MTRTKALIDAGYRIDDTTAELIDRGFIGNGCGAKFIDKIIIWLILWWYGARVVVACEVHDAGYSVSRALKSAEHKLRVDANFNYNIRNELQDKSNRVADAIARRFHSAVVIAGNRSYWKD